MKRLILICLLLVAGNVFATKHYVSTAGDNSDGTSWANAWTDPDSVNSSASISAGDSIYFGIGPWRFSSTGLTPKDGTVASHTLYACSTGAAGMVEIYGSTAPTGFSDLGSNRWMVSDGGFNSGDGKRDAVWYNDSVCWRQTTVANVNAANEYYANGTDTFVVYATSDPSGDVEVVHGTSEATTSAVNLNGADHVTFRGLNFRFGNAVVVAPVSSSDNESDSIFFEHCNISHAYGWGGNNASCFLTSSRTAENQHDYIRFVGCSLYYAIAWIGADSGIDASHGAVMTTYSVSHSRWDSCVFAGPVSRVVVWLKNDYAVAQVCDTISNSTFPASTYSQLEIARANDTLEIFGNLFLGCTSTSGAIVACNGEDDALDLNGHIYIRNNTFYDCDIPIKRTTCGSGKTDPLREDCVIKYNVFYESGTMTFHYIDSAFGPTAVDSNVYDTTGTLTIVLDSTNRTYVQFQGYGFDANSYISDTATLDGSYRLTNYTAWSNAITIGGQTFSGPGYAWPPAAPSGRLKINGIRMVGSVSK